MSQRCFDFFFHGETVQCGSGIKPCIERSAPSLQPSDPPRERVWSDRDGFFWDPKDHWTLETGYFEDPTPAIQVQTLPLEGPRSFGDG